MVAFPSIDYKVILLPSFFILVILFASSSSALEDTIYEEYCFSGLMYLMDERAEKLNVKGFKEFLNNSEMIYFSDTPLQTLEISNPNKQRIRVYICRDVMESSGDVDMLFYYTDVYSEDYEFFGCAITSNNISVNGVAYDTMNLVFNTSQDDSSPVINAFFSSSVMENREIRTEKLVVNNIVFNLLRSYIEGSNPRVSIRWYGNLTLLVPYVEGLPGKRSWDGYVKFIGTRKLDSVDRGIIKSINENKTTWVRIPNLELIEPWPESTDYVLISQTIVAVLVMVMFFYLIVKRKQELDKWKSEDEYG